MALLGRALAPRGLCRFVVCLLVLMGARSAYAALTGLVEDFSVQRSDCPVKTRWRWREEWRDYTGPAFARGTIVRGTRPKDRAELVVFQVPPREDFFAASWDCMFAKNLEDVTRDRKIYSGWHLSMGLLSWRESFKYTSRERETSRLKSSSIAMCPGDGYLVRIESFDLGFTGCLAVGKSYVGVDSRDADEIAYSAKGTKTLGLMAGPMALWRPLKGNAAFGAFVPIFTRFALWPEPNGSTVGQRIRYLWGLMGEVRVEQKTWSLAQRVGFLGSPSDIVWYFAFNKDFR